MHLDTTVTGWTPSGPPDPERLSKAILLSGLQKVFRLSPFSLNSEYESIHKGVL